MTATSTGPGAGQTTSLGQAKEPWARPVRPGDPLGDYRQRAITLVLIFKPVFANQHGVGVTAPLAHQHRAGLRHDTGVEGRAAFLELSGQALQTAPSATTDRIVQTAPSSSAILPGWSIDRRKICG